MKAPDTDLVVRRQIGVFSLTANTTPDELPVFSPRGPDEVVWYEFADVAGDVELVFTVDATTGIRIDGGTVIKGPFDVEDAPRFFYAASSTALRVTVLSSER